MSMNTGLIGAGVRGSARFAWATTSVPVLDRVHAARRRAFRSGSVALPAIVTSSLGDVMGARAIWDRSVAVGLFHIACNISRMLGSGTVRVPLTIELECRTVGKGK